MGESYMQRARGRWDVKFVALSMIFVLGGCAINPHPVSKKQLATVVQRDRDTAQAGMPALTAPLSLDEAIARALKYNLDQPTLMMEQALAIGQLDASRFHMSPRLLHHAGAMIEVVFQ